MEESIESYEEWSRRVNKGTEFEHIGEEVKKRRAERFEERKKQRALQKTFKFRLGHLLGLTGYEYKEKNL